MKTTLFALLAALAVASPVPLPAVETLTVDFNRVTRSGVKPGAAGLNLCWLLDSDLHRPHSPSFAQALADMKVGALRFPYGHLADNYLWHTPPYDDVRGGLRPRVAALAEYPGKWDWAVRPDGGFKAAIDFDEYLDLCAPRGIKPLVCVNALSWKYPGGPSYETLKAAAVAWVRYDRTKPYRVVYWQIGNEVDHHRDLLPVDGYVALYRDFAAAMKAVDPAIKVGPGILAAPNYYESVLQACPDLVDFVSVHQYMHGQVKACPDYAGWRDSRSTFTFNVERAARTLAAAGRPQLEMLVTETGVSGPNSLGIVNNTYKALWWFETLMNELAQPQVSHTFYWGTHSPWNYRGEDAEPRGDVAVALRLRDNARTPTGEIIRLVNEHLLDSFVATERVAGLVRAYAMRSSDGRRAVLGLLNKGERAQDVVVQWQGFTAGSVRRVTEFAGRNPADVTPATRARSAGPLAADRLSAALAPLSLTWFELAARE
jgi:hypothetical protein